MASYFVVVDSDSMVLASVADLKQNIAYDLAESLAKVLEERLTVARVRVNLYHVPLGIGDCFDPSKPGARNVDQLTPIGP